MKIDKTDSYFKWNEALRKYFLGKNTVFYIDENTINKIGQDEIGQNEIRNDDNGNPVSYYDDFCASLPLTGSEFKSRVKITSSIRIEKVGINNKAKISDKDNFLKIASFLTEQQILSKGENKYYEVPYFAYIIFLILLFNIRDQKWDGVNSFLEENGESKIQPKDKEIVQVLFNKLIKDKYLPENCTRTQDKYVCYIKYHLVLRNGDLKRLNEILYKHNIEWDDDDSFFNIRNEIETYLKNTDTDNNLRNALDKSENFNFFYIQIHSFKRTEYIDENLNNQDPQNKEKDKGEILFYFVIRPDGTSSSSLCAKNIRKPEILENENENIRIENDYIYQGCRAVSLKDDKNFSWKNYVINGYKYEADNNEIKSKRNQDYYIFKVHKNIDSSYSFIEEPDPDSIDNGSECLVTLIKDSKNFKQFEKNQKISRETDERTLIFNCLSPYKTFYIKNFKSVHIAKKDQDNHLIEFIGGIKKHNETETFQNGIYINTALPYLQFNGYSIEDDSISIVIKQKENNIPFTQKKCLHNRIYLHDLPEKTEGEITIEIKQKGKILESFVWKVKPAYLNTEFSYFPFKYDKWGNLISDQENHPCCYYSDNKIEGATKDEIDDYNINTINEPKTEDPSFCYPLLISLLCEIGSGKKEFQDTELNRILNYVANFENMELDASSLRRLKYYLEITGYISKYYDKNKCKYQYQTNTSRLIPTTHKFWDTQVERERKAFLLYGTYSEKEMDDIKQNMSTFSFIKSECNTDNDHDGDIFKLIPPFLVVTFENNTYNGSVKLETHPCASSLIKFMGNVNELNELFKDRNTTSGYPKLENKTMDTYSPRRCNIIQWDDKSREQIDDWSTDILRCFCRYKRRKSEQPEPIWIEPDKTLNAHQWDCKIKEGNNPLYFTKEMGKPFFFRKALIEVSLSLKCEVKAFGIDNFLGDDQEKHPLYTELDMYQIPSCLNDINSQFRKTLKQKLGGDENAPTLIFKNLDNDKVNNDKDKNYPFELYYYMISRDLDKNSKSERWLELELNKHVVAFTQKDNVSQKDNVYVLQEDSHFYLINNGDPEEAKDKNSKKDENSNRDTNGILSTIITKGQRIPINREEYEEYYVKNNDLQTDPQNKFDSAPSNNISNTSYKKDKLIIMMKL